MKTMLATITGYFSDNQIGFIRIDSANPINTDKEICIHDGENKIYYHFEQNDPNQLHDLPFFNLVFDREYESTRNEMHFIVNATQLDEALEGALLILGDFTK